MWDSLFDGCSSRENLVFQWMTEEEVYIASGIVVDRLPLMTLGGGSILLSVTRCYASNRRRRRREIMMVVYRCLPPNCPNALTGKGELPIWSKSLPGCLLPGRDSLDSDRRQELNY